MDVEQIWMSGLRPPVSEYGAIHSFGVGERTNVILSRINPAKCSLIVASLLP